MNKYDVSVINETHKRIKNKKTKIITITKKKKTKIPIDDVLMLGQSLIEQNPNKKLMIKALSAYGYIQLKGADQDLSVILGEEDYLGREIIHNHTDIYKVSFYLV